MVTPSELPVLPHALNVAARARAVTTAVAGRCLSLLHRPADDLLIPIRLLAIGRCLHALGSCERWLCSSKGTLQIQCSEWGDVVPTREP